MNYSLVIPFGFGLKRSGSSLKKIACASSTNGLLFYKATFLFSNALIIVGSYLILLTALSNTVFFIILQPSSRLSLHKFWAISFIKLSSLVIVSNCLGVASVEVKLVISLLMQPILIYLNRLSVRFILSGSLQVTRAREPAKFYMMLSTASDSF